MTTRYGGWVKARPVRNRYGVYMTHDAWQQRRKQLRSTRWEYVMDVVWGLVFFVTMITVIAGVYLGAAVIFL